MGGGAHSLARVGLRESQFRRGDIHRGTLYIYVLCGGRVLDPNEKWKKDNGFVAGKVGKYLLFVNCPQGGDGVGGRSK